MARLRVLFVASECVPFAKTGGLGDVLGALPQALTARGHDVRVVLPRYRTSKPFGGQRLPQPLGVAMGMGEERWAAVWQSELAGNTPVYLIEHDELFDRDGIYGGAHGSFGDNGLRYALLSRAAFTLCGYLDFAPDVIHVHDWQTSLAAVLGELWQHRAASVLTIHNLGYQGLLTGGDHLDLGLSWEQCVAVGMEQLGHLNLLKAGLTTATMLSTVSPRYALEIQTAEGGAGLDAELRWRSADLVGVLNGIDEVVWDPRHDPHLAANYSADDLRGKARCKRALQRELGLRQDPTAPVIGIVSRLVEQKGIDIIIEALPDILAQGAQIAVLGNGPAWVEGALASVRDSGEQLGVQFGFDEGLAHRIEAGSDLFLMPSRYEPCGLNQMYSQRYGTLPIVRAVGGLVDSVRHQQTGILFEALSGDALARAVADAIHCYREFPEQFRAMQHAAMKKKMGWDRAARHYEALYRLAIARRAFARSPRSA